MNVAYTPETKQLQGQQTLTWENPGSVPVQEHVSSSLSECICLKENDVYA